MDYSQAITYGATPTLPGQTPIVTAGQDWSGTNIYPSGPPNTAKAADPFAGFSQWAAMNGIAPEIFNGLTPQDQEKIKTTFLNSTNPQTQPPPQAPPLAGGRRRSYMEQRLWQVDRTPQVKNLY